MKGCALFKGVFVNDKTKIKRAKKEKKPSKKNYKATKKDVLAMSFGILKEPKDHIKFQGDEGRFFVWPKARVFLEIDHKEGHCFVHSGTFGNQDHADCVSITKEEYARLESVLT
jgi:hypothetical protein